MRLRGVTETFKKLIGEHRDISKVDITFPEVDRKGTETRDREMHGAQTFLISR